jgi:gliding motility-associated-like protein
MLFNMSSKTTSLFSFSTFLVFLMLLVLPSTLLLFAQGTIMPQKLGYPRICANIPNVNYPSGYNRYEVPFKLSGFAANESFIVLLSDDKGSFTTPIKPKIIANDPSAPADTPTDRILTFEVPADLIGSDIYKLRVQNLSGTVTSVDFKSSDLITFFPIHFLSYSGLFYINNQSNTVGFCTGGSVTLTIDNLTPSIPKTSPLQFPQLKYNWYKDNVLIPSQTSSTLSVDQEGEYYVEINYGPCTDINTHSQKVLVKGSSGSVTSITSSSGNLFCSSLGNTTLTASAGNSYIWKKDNTLIAGASAQTYQTNLPGIYTCEVDFGGCKSIGSIDIKVFEISSTIAGVDVDKVNAIQEGETVSVTTTTSAVSPSYQWFLNDSTIPGETKSSLDITSKGKYKVIITQTSGCIISNEFSFEISNQTNLNVSQISNIVTPNGDGTNDTWIIPDQYISGTNTQVMILSSLGEIVFKTDNYDNYNGWPQTTIDFKNYNPVYYYIITPTGQSAKKGSITLVK